MDEQNQSVSDKLTQPPKRQPVVIQPPASFVQEVQSSTKANPPATGLQTLPNQVPQSTQGLEPSSPPVTSGQPIAPKNGDQLDTLLARGVSANTLGLNSKPSSGSMHLLKPLLITIIVLAVAGGSYLLFKHHRLSSTTAATSSNASANQPNATSQTNTNSTTMPTHTTPDENPLNASPQVKSEVNFCDSSPLTC
jgi:hypothetical protein